MKVAIIISREISQTRKDKYGVFSHMWLAIFFFKNDTRVEAREDTRANK